MSGLLIPEGMSIHLTGRDDVAFVAGLPDVAAVLRDYDGVPWLHVTAKRLDLFHTVTACCIAAEAPPEALALLPAPGGAQVVEAPRLGEAHAAGEGDASPAPSPVLAGGAR